MPIFDAEAFTVATGVSRETLERFASYESLLRKWQPKINLVGPATLPDAWKRHFLDSAQLLLRLPEGARVLVDLGSGAGFPGLVLAILGVPEVHLIESDVRKCAFLREVARETGTNVVIHNRRIEATTGLKADIVAARALAPLSDLVRWAFPLIGDRGTALFPKGQNVDRELTEATRSWNMMVERIPSLSDSSGTVVKITALSPR